MFRFSLTVCPTADDSIYYTKRGPFKCGLRVIKRRFDMLRLFRLFSVISLFLLFLLSPVSSSWLSHWKYNTALKSAVLTTSDFNSVHLGDAVDRSPFSLGGFCSGVVFDITSDDKGNIYAVGDFWRISAFDKFWLTPRGVNDLVVAKLDRFGKILWAKKFGGDACEYGDYVAVDDSGNIYVVGTLNETVSFGVFSPISKDGQGIFVAKLNSSGEMVWVKSFGGHVPYKKVVDESGGVVVDSAGNVYVVGTVHAEPSSKSSYVFIAKISPLGEVLWTKECTGTSSVSASGIVVDSSDSIYLSGTSVSGKITTTDADSLTHECFGGFVVKLDPISGNTVWVKSFDQKNFGIVADKSDTICIFGVSDKNLSVTKINSFGDVLWSSKFDNAYGAGKYVITDELESIYIIGEFWRPTTFEDFSFTPKDGWYDVIVIGLDSSSGAVVFAEDAD